MFYLKCVLFEFYDPLISIYKNVGPSDFSFDNILLSDLLTSPKSKAINRIYIYVDEKSLGNLRGICSGSDVTAGEEWTCQMNFHRISSLK